MATPTATSFFATLTAGHGFDQVSLEGMSPQRQVQYDLAGRVTSDGRRPFGYDALGRMISTTALPLKFGLEHILRRHAFTRGAEGESKFARGWGTSKFAA